MGGPYKQTQKGNYTIVSTDAEKAFDKIQLSLMKNFSANPDCQEHFPRLTKELQLEYTANIIHYGERLMYTLKIRNKAKDVVPSEHFYSTRCQSHQGDLSIQCSLNQNQNRLCGF